MPPLYAYACSCGRTFDAYLPLSRYDEPQTCECGKRAQKVLGLNYIQAAFDPYVSPASGKVINGPRARRYDMDSTNTRPWEGLQSELKEADKRKNYADQKLEKTIENHVAGQLRGVDL